VSPDTYRERFCQVKIFSMGMLKTLNTNKILHNYYKSKERHKSKTIEANNKFLIYNDQTNKKNSIYHEPHFKYIKRKTIQNTRTKNNTNYTHTLHWKEDENNACQLNTNICDTVKHTITMYLALIYTNA